MEQRLRPLNEFQLFVQGQAPRGELVDQFITHERAVLLGTASFWEGVDIKGEALSCVIIDKLPFVPPNDPVMRSHAQTYEAQGRNAFMELHVPEAIISLKQGVGRLIRDEEDRGILMICDARLRTKRYGSKFIESLPAMPTTQSITDVEHFFAKG